MSISREEKEESIKQLNRINEMTIEELLKNFDLASGRSIEERDIYIKRIREITIGG